MVADDAPAEDEGVGLVSWEPLVWILVLIATISTRLYDLGARVMTHDESIHAFTSFQLFTGGVYRHDPAYHGPFLYHVNAAVYHLFGATDFTARLAPAVAGTAIVAALWMFRRYLGRTGAVVAASLVAVSPTLLFYSRHIREDIYVALFTVLWVYGAFRYLDERRPRWLFVVTISMALSFLTKESSSIFGAIIGSFFAVAAMTGGKGAGAADDRRAAADLAVLMLTLVLPFAAGPVYVLLGWNPLDRTPGTERLLAGAGVALALAALSAAAGWWQFGRRRRSARDGEATLLDWAKSMGLFWILQVTLFTGFFTNPVGGLITGIAGSMGYWLTQHEVARGGQPWFYYFIVGGMYEFLVMITAGFAAVVLLTRLWDRAFDPLPAGDLSDDASPSMHGRRRFLLFTIWWALASWGAYAWAGERMPWLLTHQVLPLVLLAGWGIARLLRGIRDGAPTRVTAAIAGSIALAMVLAVGLLRTTPFAGRELDAMSATASWWVRLVGLAFVLSSLAVWSKRAGRSATLRGLAAGALVVMALLTLRASLQLAFVNGDLPTELLSYAQASPDIKRIMRRIEALREVTPGGSDLRIAFDDETSWPLLWYFRNHRNARTWGTQPEFARDATVILAGDKNVEALQPYVAQGYGSQRYVVYWWPLQDYKALTLASLWSSLRNTESREHLWQVLSRRDYGIPLAQWPLRRETQMFVRSDASADAAPPFRSDGSGIERSITSAAPERILTGPFAGLPLLAPTSVTVAPDGAWIVADGGNHRVLVLEPDGSLRTSVDGGQLKEPWGVAVSQAGELFVADTWNGQIKVFDRRGELRRKWGRFGQQTDADVVPGAEWLYGPRGLAFNEAGELMVADTGNKRLVIFSASGQPVGTIGASSPVPEYFDEPSGLVRDPNGTILVADTWNTRIVRLDKRGNTIASWRVPGWGSRSAEDKPSLAVDGAGLVYASDPAAGRVFIFTAAGGLERTLLVPGPNGAAARPTGVAVDVQQRKLLVLDHRGGRLLVFPQSSKTN